MDDPKAFLFSLTYGVKLPVKVSSKAVRHHRSLLGSFGDGGDLYLYDYIDENTHNYSYLGNSYELPPGMAKGAEEARSYLAGAYKFKVKEIEVFRVKFI